MTLVNPFHCRLISSAFSFSFPSPPRFEAQVSDDLRHVSSGNEALLAITLLFYISARAASPHYAPAARVSILYGPERSQVDRVFAGVRLVPFAQWSPAGCAASEESILRALPIQLEDDGGHPLWRRL